MGWLIPIWGTVTYNAGPLIVVGLSASIGYFILQRETQYVVLCNLSVFHGIQNSVNRLFVLNVPISDIIRINHHNRAVITPFSGSKWKK